MTTAAKRQAICNASELLDLFKAFMSKADSHVFNFPLTSSMLIESQTHDVRVQAYFGENSNNMDNLFLIP